MTLRLALGPWGLCLLLAGAGCTTVSPSGGRLFSRAKPAADAERDIADSQTEKTPAKRDSLRADQIALTSATSTTSESAAPPVRTMDPATLMLMEMELKDLPPHERNAWKDHLSTVDPAMIPRILQERRREIDGRAQPPAPGNGAAYAAAFGGVPNGHSPLASSDSFAVPRLGFEPSLDDSPARQPPAAQLASHSRLNAPEPAGEPRSTGISPFRNPDALRPTTLQRTAELPARTDSQSGYGAPSGSYRADQMPSIAPNGAAEVSPGVLPLTGQLEVMPRPMTVRDAATDTADPASLPLADTYWDEALQRLTALIEAEVAAAQPGLTDAERLTYTQKQVYLRMLYLMARQPQRAQQAVPGINPAEQEFWTEFFWAVSNYFDAQNIPDPADRAALTISQLQSAERRLEKLARLELSNVAFCFKINSFGNFDRYERDEFRPGQPVLLYAEVNNFQSQPTQTGHYLTRLESRIEIRRGGPQGTPVEQNAFPATEDLCRSLRSDYFHSYKIDLPQNLAPGPYTLVLTVDDKLSGKSAVKMVDFLVR